MTAQELKKLLIFYKEITPKYRVGQCFQVNENTLLVCDGKAWNMYVGQYWIIVKYNQDENSYLVGNIDLKKNKIDGCMWFYEEEVDSLTLIE